MLGLSAGLLFSLIISLASVTAAQQNDTLSTDSNTTLGEPLIHEANIRISPVLSPEGPKPVRMQRGQSAYALFVCASKTWRMEQAKPLPIDSIVRDDFFPQNISFHLYVPRRDATSQVGGWACIMMLDHLLRTSASNPDNPYWMVPTMHMYYGAEQEAFGRMELESGNLPRQLGANNTEGAVAPSASPVDVAVAQGTGMPLRYPTINGGGNVQPFRRLARRDADNSTDLAGPELGANLGDDPASTHIAFTQSYTRQWMSARSVVGLLLEYLKEVAWQHHPNDPISEVFAGGEVWDSRTIGLGQRLQVTILQVASDETNVLWRDVGMFTKALLIEPTVQNKWKGWTAEVKFEGHKEPWMRIKAYVGRPGGLEVGDGETGVATAEGAEAASA